MMRAQGSCDAEESREWHYSFSSMAWPDKLSVAQACDSSLYRSYLRQVNSGILVIAAVCGQHRILQNGNADDSDTYLSIVWSSLAIKTPTAT